MPASDSRFLVFSSVSKIIFWGYFWRPVIWLEVQKHWEENQEFLLLSLHFKMMLLATACIERPMLHKKKIKSNQTKPKKTQTASKEKTDKRECYTIIHWSHILHLYCVQQNQVLQFCMQSIWGSLRWSKLFNVKPV